MTLPSFTVPTANTDTSTAEPLIITALSELKSILSGDLRNDNFAASGTANISPSKLTHGTTGQIIVCNASGVPTMVSTSGDVTVAADGALTIGDNKVVNAMIADDAVDTDQLATQSVSTSKIIDGDVTTEKIATGAVTSARIANDTIVSADINSTAGITDGQLASPYGTPWRLIHEAAIKWVDSDTGAAAQYAEQDGGKQGVGDKSSGTPVVCYLDPADYAVAGKSTKLRVALQVYTNATNPAMGAVTAELRPITDANGGNDVIGFNFDSAVASSTATVAGGDMGANKRLRVTSSTFNIPSAGHYALIFTAGGGVAANARVLCRARLELNYA